VNTAQEERSPFQDRHQAGRILAMEASRREHAVYRADDGCPMGNFPQAFSHVAAITAALSLARAGRGEPGAIW
jgi:GH15 family glucan-1,4-alpha-glucosidase